MAEKPPVFQKPVLQKPPGYRDPANGVAARPPAPTVRKAPPPLPPSLRYPGKPLPRRRGYERRSCCRRTCCYLLAASLVGMFLFAAAAALSYLWFQPRLPLVRIQSIKFPRLNLTSSSTFGEDLLDAAATVGIQLSNPNGKIGISYDSIEATISIADDDGDVEVGTGTTAGMDQGRKTTAVVKVEARASGVAVESGAGRRIGRQWRSKELRVAVEMRSRVGIMVGGKRTGKVPIRVACGAVSLRQAGGGDATLLPKCDIIVFRWINLH